MAGRGGEVICVTGGSGFIGSWIVHLLLHRGYTVRATVKDLGEERETKHLEAIEGADSRLRLFQIDLFDYDSIAASGAAGVFHVASPCVIDEVQDPQRELLEPAIKGTINVLTAAKDLGVRRVVITSSLSAMVVGSNSLADVAEDRWVDENYCRQNGLWCPLSKVLAEKAAWKFAEENGLDIVVVHPGMVVGPIIPPALNSSMQLMLRVLQATGRHLCVESLSLYSDFAKTMEKLYPEYKLQRPSIHPQHGSLKSEAAAAALKKLIDLGMEFITLLKFNVV